MRVSFAIVMNYLLKSLYCYYSENPWELLTFLVAVLALVVSIKTRVHANRLYRTNVLANFEFNLQVDTASNILGLGDYSDVRKKSLGRSDLPLVVVSWWNTTNKTANNLHIEFLMKIKGKIRIWLESPREWKKIQGNESNKDIVGSGIAQALESKSIKISKYADDFAEFVGSNPRLTLLKNGQNLNVDLYVNFKWESSSEKPLAKSANYLINIKPNKFDGQSVCAWKFQIRKVNKFWYVILKLSYKIRVLITSRYILK